MGRLFANLCESSFLESKLLYAFCLFGAAVLLFGDVGLYGGRLRVVVLILLVVVSGAAVQGCGGEVQGGQ